jgi:hypothetical protein
VPFTVFTLVNGTFTLSYVKEKNYVYIEEQMKEYNCDSMPIESEA